MDWDADDEWVTELVEVASNKSSTDDVVTRQKPSKKQPTTGVGILHFHAGIAAFASLFAGSTRTWRPTTDSDEHAIRSRVTSRANDKRWQTAETNHKMALHARTSWKRVNRTKAHTQQLSVFISSSEMLRAIRKQTESQRWKFYIYVDLMTKQRIWNAFKSQCRQVAVYWMSCSYVSAKAILNVKASETSLVLCTWPTFLKIFPPLCIWLISSIWVKSCAPTDMAACLPGRDERKSRKQCYLLVCLLIVCCFDCVGTSIPRERRRSINHPLRWITIIEAKDMQVFLNRCDISLRDEQCPKLAKRDWV